MKKWLVFFLVLMVGPAEAMFPLRQTKVSLKTDVKVKSSRRQRKKDEQTTLGVRTSLQKDTTQTRFLSIEVRNMSPKVIRDVKISYQFYAVRFEHSTGERMVFTRSLGTSETLVPSGKGELKIASLKPLEKKVVETEPLQTSYSSTQDFTKIISQTKSSGTKFGGYIIEYYVEGKLVKRDASSRRLHEAYLRSIQRPGSSGSLRMNVRR